MKPHMTSKEKVTVRKAIHQGMKKCAKEDLGIHKHKLGKHKPMYKTRL